MSRDRIDPETRAEIQRRERRQFEFLARKPYLIVVFALALFLAYRWCSSYLPDSSAAHSTMRLVNDGGETISFEVKNVDPDTAREEVFSGLFDRRREETILRVNARDETYLGLEGARRPLEMAFFDAEGELVEVLRTEGRREHESLYEPREPYRFAIVGQEGFLSRHDISVEGGAHVPRYEAPRAPPHTERRRPPSSHPPCPGEYERREQVLTEVESWDDEVRECIELHPESERGPFGTVDVEWRVRPSGGAVGARMISPEHRDTKMEHCFSRLIERFRFPACTGSESDTVAVWHSFTVP